MKYPKFLKEGGCIGFVAPSFGCNTEPYRTAFSHALDHFRAMGYRTLLGENCCAGDGIGISSTPENCGRELNDFYASRDCDALISCGGGELMCEVVPHMDFERIRQAEPKWYMGYSDNTNFTYLLTTLCDTASIYGPCASNFGMEPWHPAISDAWELLCGKRQSVSNYEKWEIESLKDEEHPLTPYHVTEPFQLRRYPNGDTPVRLRGRLLGGCMDCLSILLGTRFDRTAEFCEKYRDDGILWYLEACDLNLMGIRRAIWEMKEAGWFRYVKGFLFGRPLHFGEDMFGIDQYRAVTDLLAEYQAPILMDLDIGHLPPMMPIINGCLAEVEAEGNSFSIRYLFS